MQFRMERRAPCALAVQLAAIGAAVALLTVQRISPAPPAPCDGAAQIIYDNGRGCHADVDTMFRALAAPARPGFVRAAYVRTEGGGPWLDAERATYLWRQSGAMRGTASNASTVLAAFAAPAEARAASGVAGGQVLRYRAVVERAAALVTKD